MPCMAKADCLIRLIWLSNVSAATACHQMLRNTLKPYPIFCVPSPITNVWKSVVKTRPVLVPVVQIIPVVPRTL